MSTVLRKGMGPEASGCHARLAVGGGSHNKPYQASLLDVGAFPFSEGGAGWH